MFFKLVEKNSRRMRKDNGLLFLSLIISIVAFYVILSLENQGIVQFLKTVENDAVQKLLRMIPVLYVFTLIILFFLLYFTGKYQLEKRSHEFGMYFMMGLKRSTLFQMLIAEEGFHSLVSLSIGIPVAAFLTEVISLVTVKMVGIGLVNYHCSFSVYAVFGTIIGYVLVRFAALLILCLFWIRKEPLELLRESQEKKRHNQNEVLGAIQLFLGVILLVIAFYFGISGIAWVSVKDMAETLFFGSVGIFCLFHGMGIFFELLLKLNPKKNGYGIFNFRQLQESVLLKSNSMAVSSMLVLAALCCFGYGVSVSVGSELSNSHVMDYTFREWDEENLSERGVNIKKELEELGLRNFVEDIFEVKVGMIWEEEEELQTISVKGFTDAIKKSAGIENSGITMEQAIASAKDSKTKDILRQAEYLEQKMEYPHVISLSGYNHLRSLEGKEELELGEGKAALYSDPELVFSGLDEIIKEALQQGATIAIGNDTYELAEEYCVSDIVVDRFITISYAFILEDSVFEKLVGENYDSYWNMRLKDSFVEEEGMMQSIAWFNDVLKGSDLEYESYLQRIGRQLFYQVAASYTTIYLAVIFLLIANTVIGVQFLMGQQKKKKNYQTLIFLGGYEKELCKSARSQIGWYFGLPVAVAALSSIFGLYTLFAGLSYSSIRGRTNELVLIGAAVICLLLVVEFIYILIVMKSSDKQIHKLMGLQREDN